MLKGLKIAGGLLSAACALLCGVFLYVLCRAPVFAAGERYTLYLGDSSSARMVAAEDPLLAKLRLGNVRGESVQYDGDRYEELKERYRAVLLFTETAGGTTNYYLYSPLIRGGIGFGGHTVNLHIAVSGEKTAAGTPVIFGGF